MTVGPSLLVLLLLASTSSLTYAAGDDSERTEFRRDIHVAAGEHLQEVTCFLCSIYLRGQVAGDVTSFGGRIVLEEPAQVGGDVTAIVGSVVAGSGIKIGGDLTAVGGSIQRASGAMVGGDVTPLRKTGWLTLLLVSPLIVLGILIAAVVWFIQYLRRPRGVPAHV